jgi:ABC-type multidrug transport system fused ATPase/permease subunit
VAGATDGFLAHHVETALGWLAALVAAALVGAVGSTRAYRPLAAIVEPLRDALVRDVVRGAVHESVRTGRAGDGAVARLTQQVEIVRDTFAGLLMIVQGFVFTLAGALIGLLTLMPVTLLLVVPPVVAGLGLFLGVVSRSIARQRELVLAEERIAASAAALAAGLRDITACGAEEERAADAGRLIDAQAAAARSMARLAAGRTVALAVGGRFPLLLVLAAAPWLVRHGATPGVVLAR